MVIAGSTWSTSSVNALLAGLIGIAATLLGSLTTYLFQSRTAERAQSFERDERLRYEQVNACSAFASAITELKRGLITLWFYAGRPGGGLTGVRLSTPEGCDLRFYGCGDAGVPTGIRLRIVITGGICCWSRSVYRTGPVQRAPLGPPQGTAAAAATAGTRGGSGGRCGGSRAAQDSDFRLIWRHTGGNAAGRGRKREASAVYVHLYEGPSDASRFDATCCRPRL
jgi:hypothetical protein